MISDSAFFSKFRESVVEREGNDGEEKISSDRVSFFLEQYTMIPAIHKDLFSKLCRGLPTPPIYAFLALGVVGTNIARYTVVRRVGSNRDQVERTGAFYNFIAPSRLGKGIAFSIISTLGTHVADLRSERYNIRLSEDPPVDASGNALSRAAFARRMEILRPRDFFLTGANGLQTQAHAAQNGGCGMILVPEIKSGTARYTDPTGSYAPLLDFYGVPLQSKSFRKADNIKSIKNCRIQLIAAGVKDD